MSTAASRTEYRISVRARLREFLVSFRSAESLNAVQRDQLVEVDEL